ncbi:MAG: zinc ribbon domain-containing protein [Magnetococcales bacterium]|nr:zinc ribbon domain-containing protein [Magnetococcales bacterium]
MPLYDYKCDACGAGFEKEHPMSAPPLSECPECGGSNVRKIFSTGGLVGFNKLGQSNQSPPPSCSPAGGCATGACPLN